MMNGFVSYNFTVLRNATGIRRNITITFGRVRLFNTIIKSKTRWILGCNYTNDRYDGRYLALHICFSKDRQPGLRTSGL